MFESIGTLAYQGVSCFSHSKPSVATKIRLASPLVVCPAISASLTALLSVYHHCIGDHITPNVEGAEKSEKFALEDSILFGSRIQGLYYVTRQLLREKLHRGSKSTAPMPEKVPSSDGSYDASVWRNHTEFEEGRSSRGLLSSRSFTCNRRAMIALSSSLGVPQPYACHATTDKALFATRPKMLPAANCRRPRSFNASWRVKRRSFRISSKDWMSSLRRLSVLPIVTKPFCSALTLITTTSA